MEEKGEKRARVRVRIRVGLRNKSKNSYFVQILMALFYLILIQL
jgi:hypothetical protein